jgi:hypothetical protein
MNIKQIIEEEISISEKLDKLGDLVLEGLSEPIPVSIGKTDFGYGGEFTIENNVYTITIEETTDGDSCFLFKFTMNNSYDMVGDVRKALQVIPTIRTVVEDFIMEHKPTIFMFVKTDTSKSRERVYNEFSIEMSDKYGYSRSVKSNTDTVFYILGKDFTGDQYSDTVKFIINKYGEIN